MNSETLDKLTHRLFWFGLALYLLVLPVQHTIALRNIALLLIVLATASHLCRNRQLPRVLLPQAWAAYAGVALVSLAYAVSPSYSFSEIRVEIFYAMVLFVIGATWAKQPGVLAGIAYLLALTNTVFVAAALSKVDLGSTFEMSHGLTSFAKAGVNSNFIVTILPLLIHRAWRDWRDRKPAIAVSLGALALLDLVALQISFNRQAFVALGVGVLCAGLLILRTRFTYRRFAAFVAVLLVAAALAGWQLSRRQAMPLAEDPRVGLWRFSVEQIVEHPLTGGGFGRGVFDKLYPEFMAGDKNIWHAHNMVLNKGIQMGVPGMLAFLYLWICVARRFASRLGRPSDYAVALTGLSIIAVVFAKNMTDDFFVRDMNQLFWLIIGVLMGNLSDDPPRETKSA